jgi:hypothetical protein
MGLYTILLMSCTSPSMKRCAVLCCAVRCCAVRCCAVLCCAPQVHKLMQPYIARMLMAARRRAARRMVHFLQLTQTSSPVAVAVAHFTRRVLFIQRWAWDQLKGAGYNRVLYCKLQVGASSA